MRAVRECLTGIGPGSVTGTPTSSRKTIVSTRRTHRIVILKGGGFFITSKLHPAQPDKVGEINDKGMVAAALCFVGHTSKVPFGEPFDIVGVDRTLLSPGFLLFRPDGSVKRRFLAKGLFVPVEYIGLRCPLTWVDYL